MFQRRALLVVGLVASLAIAAWAAKAAPTVSNFLDPGSETGVFHDGNPLYVNGVGGVKSYFGVNGKDANLITYNTLRTLRLKFDTSAPAYGKSGLPASGVVDAQVDLFGINYFGPYRTQGVDKTAQVQMDLEFRVGTLTYELDYASLASYRISDTKWLITHDPNDWGGGNPGFTASPTATLRVIRRKSQESFGTVDMPIRFEIELK